MKNKVLVITSLEDTHTDYIVDKVNQTQYKNKLIRLNTEMFTNNCEVTFHNNNFKVKIKDSGKIFNSNELLSVWYRRPKKIELSKENDEFVNAFIQRESQAFLTGLYYSTHNECKWINPLPELESSRYKVSQIKLATQLEFNVPDTLISNQPNEILKFARKNSKNGIIIKSLSQPNFYLDGELHPFLQKKYLLRKYRITLSR